MKTAARVGRPRALLVGAVAGVALAGAGVAVVVKTRDTTPTVAVRPTIPPTTPPTLTAATASSSTTTAAPVAIRRRGLAGTVSLIAGDGTDGGLGLPGPADKVSLGSSPRFALAPNGDVFVMNRYNQLLLVHDGQARILHAAGKTAAFNETAYGDVALGSDGAAYVTTSGGVERFAADGTPTSVFDRAKANAGLPTAITFDGQGGMYLFDSGNYTVVRVGPGGALTRVAGTGALRSSASSASESGPAIGVALGSVEAMLIDTAGNLLIADNGARVIRRVATDGTITTIAGGGAVKAANDSGSTFAPDGSKATALSFAATTGLAIDAKGRVYVADAQAHAIYRFATDGAMELVIADQTELVDQYGLAANQTRARNVSDLAIDSTNGLMFIQNGTIRRIAGAGA